MLLGYFSQKTVMFFRFASAQRPWAVKNLSNFDLCMGMFPRFSQSGGPWTVNFSGFFEVFMRSRVEHRSCIGFRIPLTTAPCQKPLPAFFENGFQREGRYVGMGSTNNEETKIRKEMAQRGHTRLQFLLNLHPVLKWLNS